MHLTALEEMLLEWNFLTSVVREVWDENNRLTIRTKIAPSLET